MDVWITDKIDTKEVQWSKFFTVDVDIGGRAMLSYDSFFIDKEKGMALLCGL